jgi:predicted nucleic acid-binding protein
VRHSSMQERQPSVADGVLLDVDALAIYLVDDHPGHPYVDQEIEPGFGGSRQILVCDLLLLRAHWVLVRRSGIDENEARTAIRSFLHQPIVLVDVSRETILGTYDIAHEKKHDVFDCFYVAVARQWKASCILTTDTDFRKLCEGEDFEYLNPVPPEILTSFKEMNLS